MSSPTDVPPSPPAEKRSRAPRPRPDRKRTWLVVSGAIAVFAGVLAYTMTRTPPFPTQRECLAMGEAIENAKTAAQLQALFAADAPLPPFLPADSPLHANPDGLAAAVWQMKQEVKYTFLRTCDERTPDQRLLFRVYSATELIDYHEYRLDRRDGKLVVVDLRPASLDAWLGDVVKDQRGRALKSDALRVLAEAADAGDVGKVKAILRDLPPSAVPQLLVDRLVLGAHRRAGLSELRAAVAAFRTAHPDNHGADLLVLLRAQQDLRAERLDEAHRRDAIGALNQLEKRFDDEAMFTQLRRFFER